MKSSDLGKEVIKKELPFITKSPGVYRMINHKGDILYVGKAKNLPNRLKSYVSEKNQIIRTERMLSQTHKIEITTTSNESEALLLEANLIKKFKPKFNILLKDDKSFPFIFIGHKDQWPQVTKHRGKKDKDGFYFGPFASAGSANWTIKMLQKIFLLIYKLQQSKILLDLNLEMQRRMSYILKQKISMKSVRIQMIQK